MSSAAPAAAEERSRLDYRTKIDPRPQFYLFSPADERLEAMVNAETLLFPKTDEIACVIFKTPYERCEGAKHVHRCPWRDSGTEPMKGVLPIKEQAGAQDPKTGQTVRAMTAKEIVTDLIGADGKLGKLGKRGIRILFGDERDDLARQDARVAWNEAKYYISLALKQSHISINAKQREANLPGHPPSKSVMEAMAYVAKYEADFNPQAKYSCPECSWPFEDKNERDAHIVAQHRDRAGLYGLSDLVGFVPIKPAEDDPENAAVARRDKTRAQVEAQDAEYAAAGMHPEAFELVQEMQKQLVSLTEQVERLQKGGKPKKRAKAPSKEA